MTPGGQTVDVDLKAMMESLWEKVRVYNPQADEDKLWFGYRFAKSAHEGQKRKSGEPFFTHAMTVSTILADLRLDVDTLIAAQALRFVGNGFSNPSIFVCLLGRWSGDECDWRWFLNPRGRARWHRSPP